MADITQAKWTIISHQGVTNAASVEGTPVAVADAISALVTMYHAYVEAVDPGGIEPEFHVMGSYETSGDENWFHIATFKCVDPGAAPVTEPMTATEPTGETVLAVTNTTGFASGDLIYVQDAGTEADSEWHLVQRIVSNTSIDIFLGLTNQKDSSDVIWGSAQQFRCSVNCAHLKRLVCHYSNEGSSAPNTAVLVEAMVATDVE